MNTKLTPLALALQLLAPLPAAADPLDELTHCVIPKIQGGGYSSLDGGASANALLGACPAEWIAWVHECRVAWKPGNMPCEAVGLIAVQAVLMHFDR
jgi:hypothetical protein